MEKLCNTGIANALQHFIEIQTNVLNTVTVVRESEAAPQLSKRNVRFSPCWTSTYPADLHLRVGLCHTLP